MILLEVDSSNDFISAIAAAISAVSALVFGFVAYKFQKQSSEQNSSLLFGIELLKEYRSPDFIEKSNSIRKYFESKYIDEKEDFNSQPNHIRQDLLYTTHFFNQIGHLISIGTIDEKTVIGIMGKNVVSFWEVVYPLIYNIRTVKKETFYHAYFEELVHRIRISNPSAMLNSLESLEYNYLKSILDKNNSKKNVA